MLDICKKLFGDWNTKSIRYCHWKSNEHLMEGLDGATDLDVFVMPDDKSAAEASLSEVGYLKLIPQKGSRYPMVDEWLGFDYDSGRFIHVHLHYQIITGAKHCKEYIFPVNEDIIATRVLDKETDVYIAAPEIEIIILYSRIALKATDKKNISPKGDYQKEIDFLKERADISAVRQNCVSLMGTADGEEFASLVEKDALSSTEWQSVLRISRTWLKKHKKMSALTVKLRLRYFHLRAIKNAVLKKKLGKLPINKKTIPAGGKSICFIGADGSGKSTVGAEILKWLNWKVEATRFYLGSGDHYNSLLKKVLAKGRNVRSNEDKPRKAEGEQGSTAAETPKKKRSFKMRVMKYGFDVLQCIYLRKIAARALKKLKQAKGYMKKGGIALYDRFPQDQFPGLYDGPKIAVRGMKCKLFARIQAGREERALRKAQRYQPDLVFKLMLAPEESIRRKPDHSLEDVSQKAEITAKLSFPGSRVIEIDAAQPYEDEILAIKREIWSVISK